MTSPSSFPDALHVCVEHLSHLPWWSAALARLKVAGAKVRSDTVEVAWERCIPLPSSRKRGVTSTSRTSLPSLISLLPSQIRIGSRCVECGTRCRTTAALLTRGGRGALLPAPVPLPPFRGVRVCTSCSKDRGGFRCLVSTRTIVAEAGVRGRRLLRSKGKGGLQVAKRSRKGGHLFWERDVSCLIGAF